MRADCLALVHRHAANQLGKIFAEQDLRKQRFDLAELALRFEAPGPFGCLAQGFQIGRDPGQAVRHVLFAFQRLAIGATFRGF